MGDRDKEDDIGKDEEEDREVIIVSNPNIPSRRGLLTTVICKRRCIKINIYKERRQHLQTLDYFNITLLDDYQINTQKKD